MKIKTAFLISVFLSALLITAAHGEKISLTWDTTPYAGGYKIIVITHYDENDRSISTEKIYDVGNTDVATVEIADVDSPEIINVCFQIMAYTFTDIESKRSQRFCLKPWPVQNLHVE